MSKKLTFLQKGEVKANVAALIDQQLEKNSMPMLIICWNPEDPSDVFSWRDTFVEPSYIRHVLEFVLQNLK